jgi:hypothetical protein
VCVDLLSFAELDLWLGACKEIGRDLIKKKKSWWT